MAGGKLLKAGSRTALIALVIGAGLLGIFRYMYPGVNPVEALKFITVVAVALALIVDFLLRRYRKGGEDE